MSNKGDKTDNYSDLHKRKKQILEYISKNSFVRTMSRIVEAVEDVAEHTGAKGKNYGAIPNEIDIYESGNSLSTRKLQKELMNFDSQYNYMLKEIASKVAEFESSRKSVEAKLLRKKAIERIYFKENGVFDEIMHLKEIISYGNSVGEVHKGVIYTTLYLIEKDLEKLSEIPEENTTDIEISVEELPEIIELRTIRESININADDAYEKINSCCHILDEFRIKWKKNLLDFSKCYPQEEQKKTEQLLESMKNLLNLFKNRPLEKITDEDNETDNLILAKEVLSFAEKNLLPYWSIN